MDRASRCAHADLIARSEDAVQPRRRPINGSPAAPGHRRFTRAVPLRRPSWQRRPGTQRTLPRATRTTAVHGCGLTITSTKTRWPSAGPPTDAASTVGALGGEVRRRVEDQQGTPVPDVHDTRPRTAVPTAGALHAARLSPQCRAWGVGAGRRSTFVRRRRPRLGLRPRLAAADRGARQASTHRSSFKLTRQRGLMSGRAYSLPTSWPRSAPRAARSPRRVPRPFDASIVALRYQPSVTRHLRLRGRGPRTRA